MAEPVGPPDASNWRGWLRWAATADWADPASWRRFLVPWTATPQPPADAGAITVEWTTLVEAEPDSAFARHWQQVGPPLQRWWLSDGRRHDDASAKQGETELRRHMPELVPLWERLVHLAGGSALAATILSLWNPPAFLTGCSQAVVPTGARP